MTYNVFSGTLNPTHFTSLRLEERWRCIVMSTSVCVCLSVCVSVHEDISGTTAILTKFVVRVAYACGSVLRQGDKIPRGSSKFGDFPPH